VGTRKRRPRAQRVLPKVEKLKPRSPKEYTKLPNKIESIYNLRNLN
jgi:hypothetical protein